MAPKRALGTEEGRAYWVMVLPAFLIYLVVMAFPIIISITLSVSNYNGGKMFGGEPWKIIGFAPYGRLGVDPAFWMALKNNIYIVLISVFGQIPLGFILAYLISRKLVKFPDFWQTVIYIPNIISVVVVGILWQTIFSPYGPLSEIMNTLNHNSFHAHLAAVLQSAGSFDIKNMPDALAQKIVNLAGSTASANFSNPVSDLKDLVASYDQSQLGSLVDDLTNLLAPKWSADFLNKPDIAMLPILFVILWMYTGLYLIMFLANLQKIDVQIIEAARIDGASEGQVMKHIILPSLSGVIANMAILAISGSLNCFAVIYAMTGGGPARITEVLAVFMYDKAFMNGSFDYPLANAVAMVMVLISFALIGVTKALEKRFGGRE